MLNSDKRFINCTVRTFAVRDFFFKTDELRRRRLTTVKRTTLALGAVYTRWVGAAGSAMDDDPEARAALVRRRRDAESDD